eukprot:365531-Chlamydomonas_euryale.AAC.2
MCILFLHTACPFFLIARAHLTPSSSALRPASEQEDLHHLRSRLHIIPAPAPPPHLRMRQRAAQRPAQVDTQPAGGAAP